MAEAGLESPPTDFEEDDYAVVRVSIGWGTLSILAFAIVLALQLFGRQVFGLRLIQVVGATLPLSFVGLALGLIGTRLGRGRKAAKLGAFLNGVVLFCVFVLLPVVFQVLKRLS